MERQAQTLTVRSQKGLYTVRRESFSRALPSRINPSDRAIFDQRILELHPAISEIAASEQTYAVTADESLKSLNGVTSILRWLLKSDFDRGGTLYVIGGGTVQDAACFAASLLHRGVRWIYVPTTLLAQGDSCIGSKSSINFDGFKNQLGTFHPPAEIVIDDAFLYSLPSTELRSGIGEMLHYAVLGRESVFAVYEKALIDGWNHLQTPDLSRLAMHALGVKKTYIESDEFDKDLRRNLNYGHTFGHGLEFATEGCIPHGIAVAHGIDLANAYAEQRGILESRTRVRVGRVVRHIVEVKGLEHVTSSALFEGITKDKKRVDDHVELVLIEDLGKPVRVLAPLDKEFRKFLDDYLATWSDSRSSLF